MKMTFKQLILISIILVGIMSCNSRMSTGRVSSRIQTSDKYGRPSFYIYIVDDVDNHIYQEEVRPSIYFNVKEDTRLRYELDMLVSDISDIQIIR